MSKKKVLSKCTMWCWATFVAILGCMWVAGWMPLLQHEDAGQRDDSRVRQDSVGLLSLHPDTQSGTYFRTQVSFAYRSREAKTNDKQNDCLVFLPALLYCGFETQIQGLFSLSNST